MTESDLYIIGMESDTAYKLMEEICAAMGYPFPPRLEQTDTAKRDATPDPFENQTESATT